MRAPLLSLCLFVLLLFSFCARSRRFHPLRHRSRRVPREDGREEEEHGERGAFALRSSFHVRALANPPALSSFRASASPSHQSIAPAVTCVSAITLACARSRRRRRRRWWRWWCETGNGGRDGGEGREARDPEPGARAVAVPARGQGRRHLHRPGRHPDAAACGHRPEQCVSPAHECAHTCVHTRADSAAPHTYAQTWCPFTSWWRRRPAWSWTSPRSPPCGKVGETPPLFCARVGPDSVAARRPLSGVHSQRAAASADRAAAQGRRGERGRDRDPRGVRRARRALHARRRQGPGSNGFDRGLTERAKSDHESEHGHHQCEHGHHECEHGKGEERSRERSRASSMRAPAS